MFALLITLGVVFFFTIILPAFLYLFLEDDDPKVISFWSSVKERKEAKMHRKQLRKEEKYLFDD